jgi:hypothetical protein
MRFFFGVLDALADRLGTSPALPRPTPDVALAVTDDDDRAEAEPPAALDDLGDPVDLDDALLERELVSVDRATVAPSDQNSRPASRAASASDLIRPWYRNPARSKTTRSTPAAFARSAISVRRGRLLRLGRRGALELLRRPSRRRRASVPTRRR